MTEPAMSKIRMLAIGFGLGIALGFWVGQVNKDVELIKEIIRLRAEIDKPDPPTQDIPRPSGPGSKLFE